MKEQNEIEENYVAQHPSLLVNNLILFYTGDTPPRTNTERKQHSSTKKKHEITKKLYKWFEKPRKEDKFFSNISGYYEKRNFA